MMIRWANLLSMGLFIRLCHNSLEQILLTFQNDAKVQKNI